MNRLGDFAPFVGMMLALALSACTQHAVLPGSAPAQLPADSSAVFTIHWPAPASTHAVHPQYISPSTQSLSIQINNAQSIAVVVNNPGTGGTSKVTIDAPVGTDEFLIKTYDEPNAQGSVLSQAQVSQKIVAGKANTVSAVLNGVVASIGLSLFNPSPVAGTSTTSSLTVTAKDADGNVIVGPGNYDQVIHVSDSDSFATSLSSTQVNAPGPALTLGYNGNSIVSAVITASSAGVPSNTVTFSPAPHIYEFVVPTLDGVPNHITLGPDGALWFTEEIGNKIGRITTSGSMTEFAVPTSGAGLAYIVAGPDGALWFTEQSANKIGRITTGGSISEFAVPTASSSPFGIAAGPDGALWFTELNANQIGRATTGGIISEFLIPTTNSGPADIVGGPDGSLWFTENNAGKIGRITTSERFNEFVVPTTGSSPDGIVLGPDGALWFTDPGANQIGRITTGGSLSEFVVPTASGFPDGIAAGTDGALWFTETATNQIGRITTGGSTSEFAVPTAGGQPVGIAAGPDGAQWFTEYNANQIGRLAY